MNTFKNRIAFLFMICIGCALTGCSNDHEEWEDGDPASAHIYYYGFEKWGTIPGGNDVIYSVAQGETLTVPTQFHSRYVRSYSPTVYYYTTPVPGDEGVQLVCGTDYAVVDKDGNTLTPNASGAYEMTWPNAAGGVQNIYIKALNGSKGSFRVLTFDPNETMDVTDVATTTIVKTDEYEVRAFSENYYVTVTVE